MKRKYIYSLIRPFNQEHKEQSVYSKTIPIPFYFNDLYDCVHVAGGEISWHLFHKVYKEDQQLQTNLKTAPKLTASVLHLGNCKHSIPVAESFP